MKVSSLCLRSFHLLVPALLLPSSVAIDCATLTCTASGGFPGSGFATYKYGTSYVQSDSYENQVGDLYIPSSPVSTPIPVVVLLHGGYWYDQYRRATNNGSDMRPLAENLQNHGYAVVNLEYRRASTYINGDGRIPGTFNDIGDGVDALSCLSELQTLCGFTEQLDYQMVAVVGHSAGGHLALWRALQHGIGPNSYGINSSPVVQPIAAVGLAAVSDLYGGCVRGTASCSAIKNLLGVVTNAKVLTRSPYTSPFHMLDNGTELIDFYLSHGSSDTTVSPVQSSDFATEAWEYPQYYTAEPDPFNTFPREGHFDVINPSSTSWTTGVIPFLDSILISSGCSIDADCDDELYCNGAETCIGGSCQAGTPPVCDDGVACTVDTCNESTNSCSFIPDDGFCDNGLFCDGVETCNVLHGCQDGSPPVCSYGCDESSDSCFDCQNNSDCNDSNGCTEDVCSMGRCSYSPTSCCGDGVCSVGEDCKTCPGDCDNGAVCGNGVCEAGDGEDCNSCSADCNGIQSDICCGESASCSDSRCTTGGYSCTEIPRQGGSYCCGNSICEAGESGDNCAVDCATSTDAPTTSPPTTSPPTTSPPTTSPPTTSPPSCACTAYNGTSRTICNNACGGSQCNWKKRDSTCNPI